MDNLVEEVPINAGVTPALHPQMIAALTNDDELLPTLAPVINAFKVAYTVLASVHTVRKDLDVDMSMTPDGRVLAVSDYADKKLPTATRAMDAAMRQVDASIAGLQVQLTAPLKTGAERGVVATEIRNHVKALDTTKRMAFMRAAVEAGDADTVSAVLGAPSYLTGMSEPEKDHHIRQWNLRTSPTAAKRLDLLMKAKDLLDANGPRVLTETEKAVGTNWVVVQRLRERRAKTASALAQ